MSWTDLSSTRDTPAFHLPAGKTVVVTATCMIEKVNSAQANKPVQAFITLRNVDSGGQDAVLYSATTERVHDSEQFVFTGAFSEQLGIPRDLRVRFYFRTEGGATAYRTSNFSVVIMVVKN